MPARALLLPALLFAFALPALAGCGGNGTKTVTVTAPPTGPATTATATTATTPATTPTSAPSANVVHRESFRSPTGNIGCGMAGGSARCDIRERDWSPPPKPASCPVDYGQGLTVGERGRGEFVCAGDTALNPGAPIVPYGTDSVIGDLRCRSRENGVTCTNTASGHGFFIARDRYRIF